jgi:peptide/nickel transport system permease protein
MLTFTIRRLLISIPTLLFISLIIFLLLNLAPNDPMAQVPLTVPPEVKEKMREALGLGQPLYVQFWKWLVQFFWIEPQVLIDYYFGTTFSEGELRVISWQTRSPVMDMIVQRLPQTLWVVGMSYIVGILIALPIGIYSAYRHYSVFDQAGTFITMVGYSIPPFFTGPLVIVVFAVQLGWLTGTPLSFSSSKWFCRSWCWPCRPRPRSAVICGPRCWTISIRIMCVQRAPRG